jgi:hypothetical protein
MLGALGVPRIPGRRVLVLHPPAPDLDRLRRIADVVDHQDVADKSFHLGRHIGVVLVDIEAMHALPMRLHESDELRIGLVLDVIDVKAARRIVAQRAGARLDFGIDQHDVAHDAHLV